MIKVLVWFSVAGAVRFGGMALMNGVEKSELNDKAITLLPQLATCTLLATCDGPRRCHHMAV
jgi:hypothetical protein